MNKARNNLRRPGRSCGATRHLGALFGALALAGPAGALTLDTGNPDLTARFDNSVRYNLGMRTDGVDNRIGGNPTYDEGDYRFGKGRIITNRLDLLSEFEVEWKQRFGARVSAAGWVDQAYNDATARQNPSLSALPSSYIDNQYSSTTKRYYRGPSGEFLDAFGYANLDINGSPLSLKAGQFVTYWGNATFSQGGISYSQQPIDGRKGAATPGTETRELFLPLKQLSLTSQVTDRISLGAQYYLDWNHVRSPEGGTYLGGTDLVLDGPDRAGGGLPFNRGNALGPDHKSGNWGLSAKMTLPAMNATTLGLYLRQFDEKNGLWLLRNPASPLEYRAVFPRDTKLVGLSLDTTVGPLAVGAELAYRKNAGLNTVSFAASDEGARGNTWHGIVNVLYGVPSTPLWTSGILIAELTYDRLDKVTTNAALFNVEGSAVCPLGRNSGCATKQAFGLGLSFTPTWSQVLPGVDLSMPLTVQAGLRGNTADFGGTNEGAVTYSIGAQLDIRKQWVVQLTYADSHAKIIPNGAPGPLGQLYTGNGPWQTTDRGRVTFTAKTSF